MIGSEIFGAHRVCNGIRRSNLHVFGDLRCAGIECATENPGERKHVVDLIREIASARCHNRNTAFGFFRTDLGVGIRHGEHNRILRHGENVLAIDEVRPTHTDEHIGARHDVG